MSYTIIWFAKHRPDAASKTVHVSRAALWGSLVAVFVVVPAVFFYLGARDGAPNAVRDRLEKQIFEFSELTTRAKKTEEDFKSLQRRYQDLQKEYLSETGTRAELEARLEIVENARASALQRLDDAEKKQVELNDKLAMEP